MSSTDAESHAGQCRHGRRISETTNSVIELVIIRNTKKVRWIISVVLESCGWSDPQRKRYARRWLPWWIRSCCANDVCTQRIRNLRPWKHWLDYQMGWLGYWFIGVDCPSHQFRTRIPYNLRRQRVRPFRKLRSSQEPSKEWSRSFLKKYSIQGRFTVRSR